MSHFTVLVIGENPEKQLAAFHEFECTGEDNEFVQSIDETDSCKKEYLERKTTKLVDNEGNKFDPWEDKFYREPTAEEQEKIGVGGSGIAGGLRFHSKDWGDGKGYRPKVQFIPEGFEKKDFFYKDVHSFRYFVEDWQGRKVVPFGTSIDLKDKHKYGYALENVEGEIIKVINRTNPNAKWDWYQLGGRWTGYFKLKEGRSGNEGAPGLLTKKAKDGYVDQAYKKDIDIVNMKIDAYEKAKKQYEEVASNFKDNIIPVPELSWKEIVEKYENLGRDFWKETYESQNAIKELRKAQKKADKDSVIKGFFFSLDEFSISKEEYSTNAANRCLSTFAILKDGKWCEKGEMGMWACVHNEKDPEQWNTEFIQILESLSDDTLLSVYDCHI